MCSEDFSEFFRREIGPLVAFIRRAGFGWENAKDAAQEAMTKAYPEWPTLHRPRAWVRKTAYRIAIADAARTKDGVLRAVEGGWTVAPHTDPETVILGQEHAQLLNDLGTLPERQQVALAWHLDGFDNAEIAEELGVAPTTVRSHLRHARAALRAGYLARNP